MSILKFNRSTRTPTSQSVPRNPTDQHVSRKPFYQFISRNESINSSQEIQPIKLFQEISTNLSQEVHLININQSNSIQIFDNLQCEKENQNEIPSFYNCYFSNCINREFYML
ncbi:39112_t:CDS:2 [Gigaspora margarita]|uniref:39112_t:CDS:1 n=1 Tax=Gigaspora margarita TaxID=4874 RepID=A0ABM8W5N1_GIGMA|nr:39112_t:CDS:2 [Gigaspora margarita]